MWLKVKYFFKAIYALCIFCGIFGKGVIWSLEGISWSWEGVRWSREDVISSQEGVRGSQEGARWSQEGGIWSVEDVKSLKNILMFLGSQFQAI